MQTIQRTERIYKSINGIDLVTTIFSPTTPVSTPRPAIVFFFGGGWVNGTPSQFFPHCEELAALGIVAMSAEYRVGNRHGVTPFECVADAKSAVRWLRAHAGELGVDPARVAAGGGSAGGHIAACTGVLSGYDEDSEDLGISSVPDAMLLFNPVLDIEPKWEERFLGRGVELSPVRFVKAGIAPAIIFHGEDDTVVPFEQATRFQEFMRAAGNVCELDSYPGMGHGFFNQGRNDNIPYRSTMDNAIGFLRQLNWID